MTTEYVSMTEEKIDADAIRRAGLILRRGGLVAFPTETVYGLGGDALNPESSRKIYAAKGRPSDNPLIVHIAHVEALRTLTSCIPEAARRLAAAYWPGPLTMIFRKTAAVPPETTGGLDTVAVRYPSNRIARALIDAGGGFVAAPSANRSGRPSPTQAGHCREDLDGLVDMIIDGGEVGIGLESTIVDLTEDEPVILRPGYITQRMVESVLGGVALDPGMNASDLQQRPKAPGMKYRHYAPRGELTVVRGKPEAVTAYINQRLSRAEAGGRRTGVICTEETRNRYRADCVCSAGHRGREEEIARELFRILRVFDEEACEEMYSEAFDDGDLGMAIMNRLLKAAGQRVVELPDREERGV